MIRHTVVFKLSYPNNSPEEREFLQAANQLRTIPGVQQFECLIQTSKKNHFDFGISMEFESQRLYDGYSGHAIHLQFIQDYWLKYVEDFLEIDYQPLS